MNSNNKYSDSEVQNILGIVEDLIYKVKSDNRLRTESKETTTIKSFILFDYQRDENNNKEAYAIVDLDETNQKNMIDDSLDKSKIQKNGILFY